jgi:hypothetical protein
MNRSAKDEERSSLHYGGEGVGSLLVAPRCLRTTWWGRSACDPGRPDIVRREAVGADISASEIPAEAVSGVGSGHGTEERDQNKKSRIAVWSSGAVVLKKHHEWGRPRAWLSAGETQGGR